MIRRGIATAAAAWAALAATGAFAAQSGAVPRPCFTTAEVESFVTLIAPLTIRQTAQLCVPTLGTGSYFATRGEALASRFDAESATAWPVVTAATRKIVGLNLPDPETVKPLLGALVAPILIGKIKPDSCRELDQALLALDPLPARNVSQLLVQIVRLRLADKPNPNFSICRSQS